MAAVSGWRSSEPPAKGADASAGAGAGSGSGILDSTEAGARVIRGGVQRSASYAGVVALSALSAALLTRHLGVARFGEYTTVLSLVGVVAAITDVGMSTLGTREFAVREAAERDALMSDLLALRLVSTAVGVAFVIGFALAASYDSALLLGALLASTGTVALVVQHTYTIPLAASLRLGTLALLDLARQLMTVAAIAALVVLGAGVLPLLAVALVVNLVLIAPTAALARSEIALAVAFRPRRWLALLRLSVSFALATAVGTVYVYAAQIVTSLVASSHESGLFAASFRVFVVAGGVPGLLVGGALPLLARAARDDRERLGYALQRIFEVSLILGVAAAVSVLGGAGFIIEVIAGARFAGAVGVLQIQGIALVASFAVAGWSFALLSLGRYRALLLVNLASLLISCTLTLVLASSDGASGAAIATLCGESALAAGTLLALARGHRELVPNSAIVAKVLLAAAPATALALLPDVPSLVRAALALAAYAAVIWVTRALPAEVLALLPARRPR